MVKANFKVNGSGRVTIFDLDTGIELTEQPRIGTLEAISFEFRDPRWIPSPGASTITIHGDFLTRPIEKVMEGHVRTIEQVYGLEVPMSLLNLRLTYYGKERGRSLDEMHAFIKDALTFYFTAALGVMNPVIALLYDR